MKQFFLRILVGSLGFFMSQGSFLRAMSALDLIKDAADVAQHVSSSSSTSPQVSAPTTAGASGPQKQTSSQKALSSLKDFGTEAAKSIKEAATRFKDALNELQYDKTQIIEFKIPLPKTEALVAQAEKLPLPSNAIKDLVRYIRDGISVKYNLGFIGAGLDTSPIEDGFPVVTATVSDIANIVLNLLPDEVKKPIQNMLRVRGDSVFMIKLILLAKTDKPNKTAYMAEQFPLLAARLMYTEGFEGPGRLMSRFLDTFKLNDIVRDAIKIDVDARDYWQWQKRREQKGLTDIEKVLSQAFVIKDYVERSAFIVNSVVPLITPSLDFLDRDLLIGALQTHVNEHADIARRGQVNSDLAEVREEGALDDEGETIYFGLVELLDRTIEAMTAAKNFGPGKPGSDKQPEQADLKAKVGFLLAQVRQLIAIRKASVDVANAKASFAEGEELIKTLEADIKLLDEKRQKADLEAKKVTEFQAKAKELNADLKKSQAELAVLEKSAKKADAAKQKQLAAKIKQLAAQIKQAESDGKKAQAVVDAAPTDSDVRAKKDELAGANRALTDLKRAIDDAKKVEDDAKKIAISEPSSAVKNEKIALSLQDYFDFKFDQFKTVFDRSFNGDEDYINQNWRKINYTDAAKIASAIALRFIQDYPAATRAYWESKGAAEKTAYDKKIDDAKKKIAVANSAVVKELVKLPKTASTAEKKKIAQPLADAKKELQTIKKDLAKKIFAQSCDRYFKWDSKTDKDGKITRKRVRIVGKKDSMDAFATRELLALFMRIPDYKLFESIIDAVLSIFGTSMKQLVPEESLKSEAEKKQEELAKQHEAEAEAELALLFDAPIEEAEVAESVEEAGEQAAEESLDEAIELAE